jgi:hypothetical protein
MRLTLVEHSDKQFTYSAKDKTLVSEASDLDNRHLERLYDDACDVGFAVKSEKTGNVVTFVLSDVKLFPDDDGVCSWEYVVAPESIKQYPHYAGFKAVVFND